MITKEAIDYIKSEIQKGISRETITANLVTSGGWKTLDIQEAFLAIDKENATSTLPSTSQSAPVVVNSSTQPPIKKSFLGKIVSVCFKTKASSILTIVVSIFLFFVFPQQLAALSSAFGSVIFFFPLIIWILIVIILRMTGHTKEAENISMAFARIFLAIIILGIIGFGVCLLLLAGFN